MGVYYGFYYAGKCNSIDRSTDSVIGFIARRVRQPGVGREAIRMTMLTLSLAVGSLGTYVRRRLKGRR